MNKQKDRIGFKFALKGLRFFFSTQYNARIHLIATLLVTILGLVLGLSQLEWILVVLCVGLVFATELVNTAIEQLVDLISPEYNKKAGLVKDLAAAAVLTTAFTALLAGVWIFLPKIIALISGSAIGID